MACDAASRARTYGTRVAPVRNGAASATLDLGNPQGDVRILVAFVRNGAVSLGSAPVPIDGSGHVRETTLAMDQTSYAGGNEIRAGVRDDGGRGGTLVVRIADGVESDPALFDDAPGVLANGGTTAQNPASDNPTWHAYVAPATSKASDIFAAEAPRKVPTEPPTLGAAAPRTFLWRVEQAGGSFEVPAPAAPGHYILSILKMSTDGDVGASSAGFTVQ